MPNRHDDHIDIDDLDERLDAVERALTDGDHDLVTLAAAADDAATIDRLRERVDALEEQVAELDAATQALRGYVGNVRRVDREIEQRADAALAAVERLEREGTANPVEGSDASETESTPAATAQRDAAQSENAETGNRGRGAARARTTEPDPAADPCRCERCGSRRRDRGRQSASDHPEPAADGHDGTGDRDRRATAGRPAADGGRDEWARTTAAGNGDDESAGGVLASLRDAL